MVLSTVPVQIDLRQSPVDSNPKEVVQVGSLTYFTAYDSLHGRELWKTDGTAAGTQLVSDIFTGAGSSGVAGLTNVAGTLYFTANDGTGPAIWKSGGTAATTVAVDTERFSAVDAANMRAVNNTLFFSAADGPAADGYELWKAVGTTVSLVKDIRPGGSSFPANLTQVGTLLYFTAYTDTFGTELWKSDGTPGNAVQVEDILPGGGYYTGPDKLTNVNGTLFFVADDGTHGRELWKSNGSTTVMVKDINANSNYTSDPSNLTAVGSTVYFSANDGTSGAELWKSDGTTTVMVKEIGQNVNGVYPSASPDNFAVLSGTLYFSADDGVQRTLWKTTGTAATTVQVTGADQFSGPELTVTVGTNLYFFAYGTYDGGGYELWKFDGTTPSVVADVNPESDDATRELLVGGTGGAYFTATTPQAGKELWFSNGTAAGTILLKDINGADDGSDPGSLYSWNGWTYFVAYNDASQYGLYRTNGVQTELLKDQMPSYVDEYAGTTSTLYFSSGSQLWKTDGTSAGTRMVDEGYRSVSPKELTVLNDKLYFVASQEYIPVALRRGEELWTTDGTLTGTKIVKDVNLGAASSNITNLTNINGTLFFAADNGTGKGNELFKSDGTNAGTVLVSDIQPNAGGYPNSDPQNFINFNGVLYFTANTTTGGRELYKSNGTTTSLVKDIYVGSNSSTPQSLTVFNNNLFFVAYDEFQGYELFKTDGVTAPTMVDGAAGANFSQATKLVQAGPYLYFRGIDDVSDNRGYELWRTDGTAAGTVIAKDINPGSFTGSTPLGDAVNVNGILYFTADDGAHGTELWKTDGTTAGTVLAHDVFPGSDHYGSPYSGAPGSLTSLGATLFYSGFTHDSTENGRELYALVGNQPPVITAPGAQTVNEDTNLFFQSSNSNAIAVADPDLEGAPIQVTLTATNGLVTLSVLTGLTFTTGDGTADATMTFKGQPAAVNAALNGLKFGPTSNFNGNASLQVTASDLGASGLGGVKTATTTIPITVAAINDAPTTAGPATTQTFNEDATLVFNTANGNLLSIADVDAGSVQVALNTNLGLLSLSQVTGLTFTAGDGTQDSAMTFTGTVANINAALNNLNFIPTLNTNGAGVITLTVNDLGNTGSGGPKSASRTVNLSVTAVNDAPVNSAPLNQAATEDVNVVFSAANNNLISVSDVDLGANPIQVALTVTGGKATLSGVTGLTFSSGANGTAAMTFTGLVNDVNTALAGLTFTPTANFNGAASIQIVTSDQGQAGTGGTQTDTDTIAITVAAVNDAPVISGVASQTINEDATLTFNSANANLITVSDPDAASGLLQLKLFPVNGTLTIGGTTSTSFTFTNTLANLNAQLNGMVFTPTANFNGAAGVQLILNDQGNIGGPAQTASAFKPITVSAVNDAPVNAIPLGTQSQNEDVVLTFSSANGNAVSIADVDGGNAQVTLTANKGTLSLATLAGLTFTAGDGTLDATMTFSGTVAAINTALNGLKHTPTLNATGAATIQIVTSDLGNTGSGGALTDLDTINIVLNAVNDAPSVIGSTTSSTTMNVAKTFSTATGNALSLNDADAATSPVLVTLTATNGTITLSGTTGLTFLTGDGTADATITATGTLANLNAAMNGLTFTPATNFTGTATLQITVNDQGNNGGGGAKTGTKTVNIAVAAAIPSYSGKPRQSPTAPSISPEAADEYFGS